MGGPAGAAAEGYLRSGAAAPDLLNAEVLSGLRARERHGQLEAERSQEVAEDLLSLRITRYPTLPLVDRAWSLRHNFTAYDAMYVALAEAVDGQLVTLDGKLARAVREHTDVDAVLLA